MLPEDKMTEAEVSLRLGFFLIEHGLVASDVEVSIDGAQIKTGKIINFPIIEFLKSQGWEKLSSNNKWQDSYKHPEWAYKLKINSLPGRGDVFAKLKSGKIIRAESKKGPLGRSKSSQEYPLIREALGQIITINEVGESDLLAVVVPSSTKFEELALRWREAPFIKRCGILILTINRYNEVKGFPMY